MRVELEACLLTRSEASAIEEGDSKVMNNLQAREWEAIRAGAAASVPMIGWSPVAPVVATLQAILDAVAAIPGSKKLSLLGQAVERRARVALGHNRTGQERPHKKEHLGWNGAGEASQEMLLGMSCQPNASSECVPLPHASGFRQL